MKYVLALIGDESAWDDVTEDEIRAQMQPWNDFEQELVNRDAKIAGEALQPSATATTVKVGEGDERIVSDGPFAETKEQLGGFYLIEAADLDEALEWAKKVPLRPGSSIEVRPVMDYSQYGFVEPEAKAEAS
jgi:hypothetical protein